jgi:hypothetical protein
MQDPIPCFAEAVSLFGRTLAARAALRGRLFEVGFWFDGPEQLRVGLSQ